MRIILLVLVALGICACGTEAPPAENSRRITFDVLSSFPYEETEEGMPKGEVPSSILALSGKQIEIEGYMMPIDFVEESQKAKTFVLAKDQSSCCFGLAVPPNAWIQVEFVSPEGTDYMIDVPVLVSGTLEVGEELEEDGALKSLYRMRATRVVIPEDAMAAAAEGEKIRERLLKKSGQK